MTAMKLDAVGGNSFEKGDGFVGALVSLFGESDQELRVARLGQQFAFPFRLGKVFITFWLVRFSDQLRVPRSDQSVEARRDPICALEMAREDVCLRRSIFRARGPARAPG